MKQYKNTPNLSSHYTRSMEPSTSTTSLAGGPAVGVAAASSPGLSASHASIDPGDHDIGELCEVGVDLAELLACPWPGARARRVALVHGVAALWQHDAVVLLLEVHERVAGLAVPDVQGSSLLEVHAAHGEEGALGWGWSWRRRRIYMYLPFRSSGFPSCVGAS